MTRSGIPRAGARSPERLTVAEALRATARWYSMDGVRASVSARRIERCRAEDSDQLSTTEAGWLLCRPRQYIVGLIRSRKLKAIKAPFRDSWRWLVRFADVKRVA